MIFSFPNPERIASVTQAGKPIDFSGGLDMFGRPEMVPVEIQLRGSAKTKIWVTRVGLSGIHVDIPTRRGLKATGFKEQSGRNDKRPGVKSLVPSPFNSYDTSFDANTISRHGVIVFARPAKPGVAMLEG